MTRMALALALEMTTTMALAPEMNQAPAPEMNQVPAPEMNQVPAQKTLFFYSCHFYIVKNSLQIKSIATVAR